MWHTKWLIEADRKKKIKNNNENKRKIKWICLYLYKWMKECKRNVETDCELDLLSLIWKPPKSYIKEEMKWDHSLYHH